MILSAAAMNDERVTLRMTGVYTCIPMDRHRIDVDTADLTTQFRLQTYGLRKETEPGTGTRG
jgi:hypothetical protein